MRRYAIFPIIIALLSTVALKAQYDDVYYDPSRDTRNSRTTRTDARSTTTTQNNNNNSTADYDDQVNQDEYYEYDDEYDDYQYSSRIRRFHRPLRGFNYYDLTYVDYYYYDPYYYDRMFARPGISFSFGNTYWNRYDRYNRWNTAIWYNRYWDNYCAFNSWNTWGMPSWGMNRYNSFYDPYGYNSYGGYYGSNYGGYGYNPYRNGYSNNYNNNYNNNVGVNVNNPSRGRTYAPRTNSTLAEPVSPTGVVRNGRSGEQPNNAQPERGVVRQNNRIDRTNANGEVVSPREPGMTAPNGGTTTNRPRYNTESSDENTRPAAVERQNRSRTNLGAENTEGGTATPQRSEMPVRQRNYEERPSRTYEQRSTETERSARTERPNREYQQRTETRQEAAPRYQPRQESRQESAPRYEAPRQETRSYSPPPQQQSAPAPQSAPSRSNSRSGSREE